jgi:hypothetical protein
MLMDTDPYPNQSSMYRSFCKQYTYEMYKKIQKGLAEEEYFLTLPEIIYFNTV